jgi:hypothetical protein
MLLNGVKEIKAVRSGSKTKETDRCCQKYFAAAIARNTLVVKALLSQHMLPWISTTYPD